MSMTGRAHNIAVVLAGGSGRRVGGPEPKQLLMVAGHTVVEYSVRAFALHPLIDEVMVVAHSDYEERIRRIVSSYRKVQRVVRGGAERYDSSLAAIHAASSVGEATTVRLLIHDAARPFVSSRIIDDCIVALDSGALAVDVAIPATDTIAEVDGSGKITRIPSRSTLRSVQTPQCFRLDIIAEAYRRGMQDTLFAPTDDCGVVHRYMPDVDIHIVEGEPTNIKITYPADIELAERLLGNNATP